MPKLMDGTVPGGGKGFKAAGRAEAVHPLLTLIKLK